MLYLQIILTKRLAKVYVKVADGLNYFARYIDISASSGYIWCYIPVMSYEKYGKR